MSIKKRCHWFFCCNFYKYWRKFSFVHNFARECQTHWRKNFLPYIRYVVTIPCESLGHKSITFHTNISTLHMFTSIQYRWNKQNTAESQRLKIYVQNVHHLREHTHLNDYATAQSLMVSVAVSSLGATQLHFVEPGLKSTVTITEIQFCWICFWRISALFSGITTFFSKMEHRHIVHVTLRAGFTTRLTRLQPRAPDF